MGWTIWRAPSFTKAKDAYEAEIIQAINLPTDSDRVAQRNLKRLRSFKSFEKKLDAFEDRKDDPAFHLGLVRESFKRIPDYYFVRKGALRGCYHRNLAAKRAVALLFWSDHNRPDMLRRALADALSLV